MTGNVQRHLMRALGGTPGQPGRRAPDPTSDRPLVVLLIAGLVLAMAAGTQYFAWRADFPPAFGAPLFVLSAHAVRLLQVAGVLTLASAMVVLTFPRLRWLAGPLLLVSLYAWLGSTGRIYPPYGVFLWHAKWGAHPGAAAPWFRVAWILILIEGVGTSYFLNAGWRRLWRGPSSRTLGSAHWGTGKELHHKQGLLLGREGRKLLRLAGEGHILTVAPTRSGKGVSAVIPNLLDHPGSIFATDPKGENFAVTARWRSELGQTVHAFDPFGVAGGDAKYNPLDLIDASLPEAVDDARVLADMLVLPGERGGAQAFWDEEARGVLTGLILHVAANDRPELRTLAHVRTLLTLPPESFAALLQKMQDSPAAGGLVASASARISQKAEEERSGVISTAQSHTHFLDSPRAAQVLSRSNVDLAWLKQTAMTVYLILPTERLDTYARWLRLMIGSALLAMARTRGQPQERVLFLLDEFAHLGPMDPVQRYIGLAGGFGVTFWLIVQDLSQLRSTYGDTWPTFLANVDVLQAFGVNDLDTAEYLSKMTGEATVQLESEHHSHGLSGGPQTRSQVGAGLTQSETTRRLLLPDEVRRLPAKDELLFIRTSAPLLVERLNYLCDREFAGRADSNPWYTPVADALG